MFDNVKQGVVIYRCKERGEIKMTLAQIIEQEQRQRIECGAFGIKACKESIKFAKEVLHDSYYAQLENFCGKS